MAASCESIWAVRASKPLNMVSLLRRIRNFAGSGWVYDLRGDLGRQVIITTNDRVL